LQHRPSPTEHAGRLIYMQVLDDVLIPLFNSFSKAYSCHPGVALWTSVKKEIG
jgi:hypothetical protein